MNYPVEERTRLISSPNGGQGGRRGVLDDDSPNGQVYYDSFPRIGSPEEDENNQIGGLERVLVDLCIFV